MQNEQQDTPGMQQDTSGERSVAVGGDATGPIVTGNRNQVAGRDLTINEADKVHDVRGLENPYLGLAAFTYAERAKYAGRDQQLVEAVARLTTPGEQRALLFITGASGSGKSSFAQAGLIPALEQHYQQRHITLRHAVFRPSKYPLAMLVDAVQQLGLPAGSVSVATFATFLWEHTPEQVINVIIIDQLEEVFTQSEHGQRDQLFALLTSLPPFAELRTHFIATVRADYLPELFPHQALYAQVKAGIELRAMSEEELKAAIQQPLMQHPKAEGKCFEDALLDKLAADAAADAAYLPLLQVTLEKLWADGWLKLSAYGSLTDAIRQRAEEVYTRRGVQEQTLLIELLLDLVAVAPDEDAHRDVRRRRALAALRQDDPLRARLLDDLVQARLLSTSSEPADTGAVEVVDIIHESLLRNWPRLRAAIDAQREDLKRRARFEQALREWLEQERAPEYLLTGIRLSEAEALESQGDVALHSPEARALLAQSIARRERQRRRVIGGLAAALLMFAVLAVLAGWFGVESQRNAQEAATQAAAARTAEALSQQEAERADNEAAAAQTAEANAEDRAREAEAQARIAFSRQLAAYAASERETNLHRSLLLATHANTLTPTLESRSNLLRGVQFSPHISATLHGLSGGVSSLAYRPDGQTLAAGYVEGNVILWDVTTRQQSGSFQVAASTAVESLAFSPDGQTLAVAGDDFTITLWDVATQQQSGDPLAGHTSWITSLAFSPDGQTLASGSEDDTVMLWDVATQQPIDAPLAGPTSSVTHVAFSPDAQTLAAGYENGSIRLWDVTTGEQLDPLDADTGDAVVGLAFTSDEWTLAAGYAGDTIIFWNIPDAEPVETVVIPETDTITSVAFNSNEATFAFSNLNNTIRRWDTAAEDQIGTALVGHRGFIDYLAFSPDGQSLASGSWDGSIILWDVTTRQPLATVLAAHTRAVYRVAFRPDGQTLASGSWDGSIILWDMTTRQPIGDPLAGPTYGFSSVAFSPDGQTLVTNDDVGSIILWDVATRQPLGAPLASETEGGTGATFSPDGQTLAVLTTDRSIMLWDVTTRLPIGDPLIFQPEAPWEGFARLAFSPDGHILAAVSTEDTIILWDVATRQPIGDPLAGHTALIHHIAFSPDGQTLASGSEDGTVMLWAVATRQPIGTLREPQQERGMALPGGTDGVTSVAFSPDGQTLAAGNHNNTILLWDVATRQPIGDPLAGDVGSVTSIAFSPDGQTLAASNDDGTVMLWAVGGETLQARACRAAGRNLTWEEWQRYLPGEPYAQTCPDLPPHPGAVEAGVAE